MSFFRFAAPLQRFHFLSADGSRLPDYQLKDIDVLVGSNGGYRIVHIPIVPLKAGPLQVVAKIVHSDDLLITRTDVVHEGLRLEAFKVLNVDMTVRPAFIGVIDASGHTGLPHATSRLVITGGVAATSHSGLTASLGLPSVTADEAVFAIESSLQSVRHAAQTGTSLTFSTDTEMYRVVTEAYQRLLSYQISDGSNKGAFSYSNRRQDVGDVKPSTFLTALAISTLYKLRIHYKHPIVDGVVLQRGLHWLFKNQHDEGSFREFNIYHGNYQSSIPIEFQEVALTSHVVISLSHFLDEVTKYFKVL